MEEIYANAFNEVYILLGHMPTRYVRKLPKKFLYFLEENRNKKYDYQIDISKKLSEQHMSVEAKAIISNLYKDYWITSNQREKIIAKEKYELQKEEEEKRKRYDPDKIFKDRKLTYKQ